MARSKLMYLPRQGVDGVEEILVALGLSQLPFVSFFVFLKFFLHLVDLHRRFLQQSKDALRWSVQARVVFDRCATRCAVANCAGVVDGLRILPVGMAVRLASRNIGLVDIRHFVLVKKRND